MSGSRYEEGLARQITLRGLPPPERQYSFALPHRQYRVDFAWPDRLLAVEVDGGAFVGRGGKGAVVSRTMPVGYHSTVEDYRKKNLLNQLGWRVLSFQPQQIALGEALSEIEIALESPDGGRGLREPWLEKLWVHVARLKNLDRLRRRVRDAKTKQRRALRSSPRGMIR